MSEHYTLDELAELDAGLLARRAPRASRKSPAAAATRHLADCDECRALADALHKTQDRLRDLGPVEMPADVVARLERALDNAGTTSGDDVVPDLAAVRARRFGGIPPRAYAAAAAVVVLGGTAIAIGTLHHGKNGVEHTTLAPLVATSAPTELIQQESGQTYTPDSIDELATGLLGSSAEADSAGSLPAAPSNTLPAPAAGGGTSSNKGTAKAPSQFAGANPPALATRTTAIAPSLRHLADSRDALLRCAAFITDTPNAAPLAVDFGRWTNASAGIHRVPSVVMVFNDPDDTTTLDVYVVGAACDDSSLLNFQVLQKNP